MIIERIIDVNYSCEQMYNLVSDYEAYPQFIKNCTQAHLEQQTNTNQVLAELEMSFSGLKQKFSTYTTFSPYKMINMELAKGPFKKLHGYWEFEPKAEKGCIVKLYMDYELSPVIELLVGKKFETSINQMVDSFLTRAQEKLAEI